MASNSAPSSATGADSPTDTPRTPPRVPSPLHDGSIATDEAETTEDVDTEASAAGAAVAAAVAATPPLEVERTPPAPVGDRPLVTDLTGAEPNANDAIAGVGVDPIPAAVAVVANDGPPVGPPNPAAVDGGAPIAVANDPPPVNNPPAPNGDGAAAAAVGNGPPLAPDIAAPNAPPNAAAGPNAAAAVLVDAGAVPAVGAADNNAAPVGPPPPQPANIPPAPQLLNLNPAPNGAPPANNPPPPNNPPPNNNAAANGQPAANNNQPAQPGPNPDADIPLPEEDFKLVLQTGATAKNKYGLRAIFVGPPGSGKTQIATRISDTEVINIITLSWAMQQVSKWERVLHAAGRSSFILKELASLHSLADVIPPEKQCEMLIRVILEVEAATKNKSTIPVSQNGWILDTSDWYFDADIAKQFGQAFKALDWNVTVVEFAHTTPEVEVARIQRRLVHPASGRVYNKQYNPPRKNNRDDVTGDCLIQRSDDSEISVPLRVERFHSSVNLGASIEGLVAGNPQMKHVRVDASQSVYRVESDVRQCLNIKTPADQAVTTYPIPPPAAQVARYRPIWVDLVVAANAAILIISFSRLPSLLTQLWSQFKKHQR